MVSVKKTNQELRKFGITVSIPLFGIGAFLLWKQVASAYFVLGAASVLFIFGLIFPAALTYVERIWMKFALVMSYVMTRVILTVAFILVIAPFGFMLRLMGKDLLQLKIDRDRNSYWDAVEVGGPATRPDKPF